MGSNATGKTSLGRLILSIFILIGKRNVEIITSYIADKDKKASFSMDFVNKDHDIYKYIELMQNLIRVKIMIILLRI